MTPRHCRRENNVAVVVVAVTLKDKVEERGEKEKEGNQGDVERKKTEGAGTSQVIQDHGLSQEKDDMIDFRMSHQSRGRSSRRKRREIKV